MNRERTLNRFRGAMLAIAGMIMVSAVGAGFSYLLIESSVAATSFGGVAAGVGSRDGWPCPDHMADHFVATRLLHDAAEWTGLETSPGTADPDGPHSVAFLDPIATAEIVFPLLTLLVVVTVSQRLAENGRGGIAYGAGSDPIPTKPQVLPLRPPTSRASPNVLTVVACLT